jgi:hypothetical protein
MSKNKKDLPAKSDINKDADDTRLRGQEEFDNRGKDELQRESEVRNAQQTEQMRDSQQGDERMKPDSKAKQSPEDYREDRKLPQMKK